MDSLVTPYLKNIQVLKNGNLCAFVGDKTTLNDMLENLGVNGYQYSTIHSKKKGHVSNQLEHNYSGDKMTVRFTPWGSPYYSTCFKKLLCIHGGKYKPKKKKSQEIPELQDHPSASTKKKRNAIQPSRKIGCGSYINLNEIKILDELKTPGALKLPRRQKDKLISKAKELFKTTTIPTSYHVEIACKHSHRIVPIHLNIDSRLVTRIEELVKLGVTSVRDLQIHLEEKVNSMFEKQKMPDRLNSRYYPSDRIVYATMNRMIFSLRKNLYDQDALENKCKEWISSGHKVFFRPYNGQNNFLNVLQTDWQQKIMVEFGNSQVCHLDATYKTTKYPLPLFFIAVKSNSRFLPVASFVTMGEDSFHITEALEIVKNWNLEWHPKCFMVDFSHAEINAVEKVFPSIPVYICAFHREQAWERWAKKHDNLPNKADKSILLSFLRKLAHADSEIDFEGTLKTLKEHSVWLLNPAVQGYISNTWLPERKRWMDIYTTQDKNSTLTNNGIETLNKTFKSKFLYSSSDRSLTGVCSRIIQKFLPFLMASHKKENFASLKSYADTIPEFLYGKSQKFIKLYMEKTNLAIKEFSKEDLVVVDKGLVLCKSSSNEETTHKVDFVNFSCTCIDFKKSRQLCKHFCAAFLYVPGFTFFDLPDDVINNPVLSYNASAYSQDYFFDGEEPNLEPNLPENEKTVSGECISPTPKSTVEESCTISRALFITKIKKLLDTAYICDEDVVKQELADKVDEVQSVLALGLKKSTENSMALLPAKKKKKDKLATLIPKKNSKKHLVKHKNRVGATAEMWREATNNKNVTV